MSRNRKPGSATAWFMRVALLPYVGALLFLLIGGPKLSRHWRQEAGLRDRTRAFAHSLVALQTLEADEKE
ncbi:MAG: PLD nuclease N-terminal domain-containing protein [Longimicrobiales bacterium]